MNVNTLPSSSSSSSVSFQRLHRLHTEYTTSIAHTAHRALNTQTYRLETCCTLQTTAYHTWKYFIYIILVYKYFVFDLFLLDEIYYTNEKEKKVLLFLSKAEKKNVVQMLQ